MSMAPCINSSELTTVIIRAKYYLWNQDGRWCGDPHTWLCQFLDVDRVKMKGVVSNFTKFRRVCRQLKGDKTLKVTLADVWRQLALYHIRKSIVPSDDSSN